MIKQFSIAICLIALFTITVNGAKLVKKHKPGLYAGQGIMMGELTSTSIHAQIRLTESTQLVNGDVTGRA